MFNNFNDGKKRLFIALNPPLPVKKEITDIIINLGQKNQGVKWVRPEGLHLTLHFLGYLNEGQNQNVQAAMAALAEKFEQMDFIFKKISAFPSLQKPRVICLSGEQISGNSVFALQKALGNKLAGLGIELDHRPWQPHITLGRVKTNYDFRLLICDFNEINFSLNSFELMEAILRPSGAIYREIISFKLR